MTEAILCVVCPVYRPKAQPRLPNNPAVCDTCRDRLATDLTGLPALYASLPEFLEPGRGAGEMRTKGFESQVPARLTVFNLLGPGSPELSPTGMRWMSDQIGDLPPVEALAWIVVDMIEVRAMRESQPPQQLDRLTEWLGNRLDWICRHHPAVDDFAAHISAIVHSVRAATGAKRLVHKLAAPCPTCDTFELERDDGADYVECRNCHRLWTEDEYRRLCIVLAAEAEAKGAA